MDDYKKEVYRGHTIHIVYDDCADSPRNWSNVATFVCEHRNYNFGDVHNIESEINDLFGKYVKDADVIKYFCESRNAKLIHDEEYGENYYEYSVKYRNGDSHTYRISADQDECHIASEMEDDFSNSEKLMLVENSGEVVLSAISIYDHSGVSIWLGGTAGHVDSQWDCSTVGFAYVEKSTAEKEGALRAGKNGLYNGHKSWQDWAYAMMEDEMEVYSQYVSGEVFGYYIDSDEYGCECNDSCYGYYGSDSIQEMIDEAKASIDYFFKQREIEHAEYKSTISENIDFFIGYSWMIDGYVYRISDNIFGNGYIERSVVKDNLIKTYEPIDLKDLLFSAAKIIAGYMKQAA